ncbi:MAG: carbamate kinase [Bacteroidetes bacterium GWE2_29_8]|nr:MAG: carbamate kinase [Bacteroidetes bacterium GWE2_29_8]OFY15651.1 MAG: carbamate kinase [Bacteroidetes bacterium GWF2_29_10]
MNKLAVIAFGGNALIKGDQAGTFDEQEKNVYETCSNLVYLIEKGYDIVIGHGNGPQVGNVLLQHEAGLNNYKVPKMPLDFCVAETQGSIGYIIEQQLKNVLLKHNINKNIVTIVTQVFVDKNDPAFSNPQKPVGPFYSKEEAQKLIDENGWVFNEDPRKRGWRRVVASPTPIEINNSQIVKQLASEGNIVITVGGGGIPVFYNDKKEIVGIDAVIDKDLASAMLAARINADEFYILTDVPKVCINFHKPDEIKLDKITIEEANRYIQEGHFAEGSMAPKVRAAINFIVNGGHETIITEAKELQIPNCGTKIVK